MGKVIILYVVLSFTIFTLAIHFGWLETIALIFAILALFPIVTSFFAYYLYAPKLHYEISQKVTKQDDGHIYEMMMTLECKRGRIILKKMNLSGYNNIDPVKHPASAADFNYLFTIEESGSILSADFGISEHPLSSQLKHLFPLAFKSSSPLETVPIRIVLDIGIDPMRLGVISIIPVIFNYRYYADINVNYSDPNSQNGRFKRFYI